MIVKPKAGLKVRHPVTKQVIPEAGIEVPDTEIYWARRLRAGDVVQAQPAAKPAEEPAAQAAGEKE